MSRFAATALALTLAFLPAAARAGLVEQCAWPPPGGPALYPGSDMVEMAPIVADLDADGSPEIVIVTFADGNDDGFGIDGVLRILRGSDCAEIATVGSVGCVTCFGDAACRDLNSIEDEGFLCPGCGVAVGDLDDDGDLEIVAIVEGTYDDVFDRRFVIFDHSGAFVRCSVLSPERVGAVAAPVLADLDADGTPEIVARTTAWALDGSLRWAAPASGIGMSTAADLHGDGLMEVISGEAAYDAFGTRLWWRQDLQIGSSAVADLDLDCVPEVILTSRNTASLHVLDAFTGATRASAPLPVGDCPPRSDGQGGPPTLADTDGDCVPEIGVAGCRRYGLFRYDAGPPEQLTLLWESPTDDSSSRFTGSAIFDLDGDGTAEILYNDHAWLRIYDAVTGAVEQQAENSTFTLIEFPVVADADADGLAEIVVSANDYAVGTQAGLRVFHDDAVAWAPAAPLFNQHSFHVTNVLPDGRIPAGEEPSWARYNSFRVQSSPVRESAAPVLHGVPADVSVHCRDIPPPPVVTATGGGCDDVPVVTFTETAIGQATCGSISRLWRATNRCGMTASGWQTITTHDDEPPVITLLPGPDTFPCDAPEWGGTGAIATDCVWGGVHRAQFVDMVEEELAAPCRGERRIRTTWIAEDDCGNSSSLSHVVSLVDTSAPVLGGVPADVTLPCGAPVEPAAVTISDTCDTAPVVSLAETEAGAPCSRTLTRTWTGSDDCGNVTNATQVITFVDDAAPALTGVPADVTLPCGSPLPPASPAAIDACDAAPSVTLAQVETGGPCDRVVTRTWTARDACGNEVSATQVVTFVDAGDPSLSGVPADLTLPCDAPLPPASPAASDACDPAPVVTLAQAETGGPCDRVVTRTWTARDACGNETTAAQVVTFADDEPPALSGVPADASVRCDAVPPPAAPSAADDCSAVTVTSEEVRTDGGCPDEYRLDRTWTATDACGNAASATQVILVSDDGPPVLVGVPGEATAECGSVPPPATVTVLGGCDPAPLLAFEEARIDGDCPSEYDLVRTWTATDRCGRTATASQVVHVVDTTPPAISGFQALCLWSPNHWFACLGPEHFSPAVEDACGGGVTWRFAGCASDQPEDALGDGAFAPDCKVEDGRLCFRSERQGMVPEGRHYGVMAIAVDACGNESAPALIGDVWVPRDQRDHPGCLKIQDVGDKGHGRP